MRLSSEGWQPTADLVRVRAKVGVKVTARVRVGLGLRVGAKG